MPYSGHHKSQLSNFNYYIKIGLVPVKPSRRTTFWTALFICGEKGSALSSSWRSKQALLYSSNQIFFVQVGPNKCGH